MQLRGVKRARDFPPIEINWQLSQRTEGRIGEKQQKEWLKRSKQWSDFEFKRGNVRRWSPRKVLGAGTFGIVGLWTYLGTRGGYFELDNDRPPNPADRIPAQIAVKQTGPSPTHQLQMQWESKLLQQLMGTGTDHVVKIYKGYHRDGGTGTSALRDPVPFDRVGNYDASEEVSRIYLEYCAGGDMEEFLTNLDPTYIIPEEQVWRIMLCMFKGLLVLQRGTEDTSDPLAPALWNDAIVHFDIKPRNTLIGERDIGVHQRLEMFKLTDFGSALPMPSDPNEWNGDDWVGDVDYRDSEVSNKEQIYEHNPAVNQITWKTGIWSVAACIFKLCSVCSADILFDNHRFPYSEQLVFLLCSCLSFMPDHRPEIIDVVRQAQLVVDGFDAHNNSLNIVTNPDSLTSGNELHVLASPMFTGAIPVSYDTGLRPRFARGNGPSGPREPGGSSSGALPLMLGGDVKPPVRAGYPFTPVYNVRAYHSAVAAAEREAAEASTPAPGNKIRMRIPAGFELRGAPDAAGGGGGQGGGGAAGGAAGDAPRIRFKIKRGGGGRIEGAAAKIRFKVKRGGRG